MSSWTSATKWGDIGDWDVSGVGDFSYAFSANRNEAGGSYAKDGNPKAATFVGTAISKWNTASATDLAYTFYGASEMNADLIGWKVEKVVILTKTFNDASKFAGTGLSSWDTTSVTNLDGTFSAFIPSPCLRGYFLCVHPPSEMNADLSTWNTAKVKTLGATFYGATKFAGTGIGMWITASVTSLYQTFQSAGEMNGDVSKWNVAKVTTLYRTFEGASKFVGTGLSAWITTSLTRMDNAFTSAGEMNADLTGWKVGKVISLVQTFNGAAKFTGTGVDTWNIAEAKSMSGTFTSTTSLTTCNKRKIADAWKSSAVFVATTYDTDWAADSCTVRFE